MRLSAVCTLLVMASGCASLLGIDDEAGEVDPGDAGASSSSGHDAPLTSSSGGSSGRAADSGPREDGSVDAGADAAPSPCPSPAAICQPETVLTQLRSPGELTAVGHSLVFREHAKDDGGSFSVIRSFDPAGTCSAGPCLETLATDTNVYRLPVGNDKHVCFTVDLTIHCLDAVTHVEERVLEDDFWWYQAAFVEDDTLLYGTAIGGGVYELRVLDLGSTDLPYRVVGPNSQPIEHVVAQSDPAGRWFGWNETDVRLAARPLQSPGTTDLNAHNDIVSVAAVDDAMVWTTLYGLYTSRYLSPGFGADITGSSFAACAGQTERTFRSITPARGAVVAIEGCSIPGSLGSAVVLYPLDQSAPTLLATAPLAISSAVVVGDYVYYAISRIQAMLGNDTTEEIRRVRYR